MDGQASSDGPSPPPTPERFYASMNCGDLQQREKGLCCVLEGFIDDNDDASYYSCDDALTIAINVEVTVHL